jgi:hypothetical protein
LFQAKRNRREDILAAVFLFVKERNYRGLNAFHHQRAIGAAKAK